MKRIGYLTAKEKYKVLCWANVKSGQMFLCDRIADGINELFKESNQNNFIGIMAFYGDKVRDDIQNYFHMLQFKPKFREVFWWDEGDPAREEAWQKLIEYWKHEAEKESK